MDFEGRLLVVASDGGGLPSVAGPVEATNSVIGPPVSVTVSPDGMLVAIAYATTKTGGTPLGFIRFANGRLGKIRAPPRRRLRRW